MDVSKLCRSCMKEVASWERENFDPRAVEMFCFCTNIKIADDDKLPRQFCYDCIIKIESSYTFVTEAQKVNITLRNIISRAITSIIVKQESISNVIDIPITNDSKVGTEIKMLDKPLKQDNNSDEYFEADQIEDSIASIPTLDDEDNSPEIITKENNDRTPNKENKEHVCPICRKMFTFKIWFDKHMAKVHTTKHSCTHCPKSFPNKLKLKYHMVTHSEERRFRCPEPSCGKNFKRRQQLAGHACTHTDVRPYACDKCPMKFKLKSVLKGHMKQHEESKKHLCYHCGSTFMQVGNLKVHMRIHTGEKPFKCGKCEFSAAAASNLRRHERCHKTTAPYACEVCQRPFKDSGALGRHKRMHTGELPFKCPECDRAFIDSWKRKTHLMRAHRRTLADIPRMRRDGRPLEPK